MEDKRLNFGHQLHSTRRFAPFPLYKSELKSGPVCSPGMVPFGWEKSPGMPKTAAPSDSRESSFEDCITEEAVSTTTSSRVGEAEEYSDAPEELSRTESFFFNCSLGGISGLEEGMDATPSGILSSDLKVQDLMMGRFLPAAKAMAAETPTHVNRKQPTRVEGTVCISRGRNGPKQLRYEECKPDLSPNYAPELYGVETADEDEDGDCSLSEDRSMRGCGLLSRFCVKAPFRVMNVVPETRVKDGDSINKLHSGSSNKLFHGWLKQKYAGQARRSSPKIYDLGRSRASPKQENSPLPAKIQLHRYRPRFSLEGGRTDMYVLGTKRKNDSLPKEKPSTSFRDLLARESEERSSRSKVPSAEKNIFADYGKEVESRADASESKTDYRSAAVVHPKSTIRSIGDLGQRQGKVHSNMSRKRGTLEPVMTRLCEVNRKNSCGHYSNVPLSPPLPNSPSESWLFRTLPFTPSPKPRAFLGDHRLGPTD